MSKRPKEILVLIFCLLLGSMETLSAQSFAEIRAQMITAYQNAKSFSVNIVVETGAVVQSARFMKDGAKVWYQWGSIEMLTNANYHVMVDHQFKTLIVQPANDDASEEPFMLTEGMDSLLLPVMDKIKLIDQKGGELTYLLDDPAVVWKLEVVVDAQNYWIKELKYLENEQMKTPQMRIAYQDMQVLEQVSDVVFDEAKYFEVVDDQLLGVGRYKRYKIIMK